MSTVDNLAGFQIFVKDSTGSDVFLVDGGFTDWTQKLLSDRKERLLISGMGTERFLVCFSPKPENETDERRRGR